MSENPEPQPVDPALVKYLRGLVTVLTVTMIAGFIVIIGLFVTKFSGDPGVELPAKINLPDGVAAQAFTRTDRWYAIVTADNRILVYTLSGTLIQEITVTSGN